MTKLIGRTEHGDDVFATDEVAELLDAVQKAGGQMTEKAREMLRASGEPEGRKTEWQRVAHDTYIRMPSDPGDREWAPCAEIGCIHGNGHSCPHSYGPFSSKAAYDSAAKAAAELRPPAAGPWIAVNPETMPVKGVRVLLSTRGGVTIGELSNCWDLEAPTDDSSEGTVQISKNYVTHWAEIHAPPMDNPRPSRAAVDLGNGKTRPLSPEERSALDHAADSLGTFVCPGCGGTFWVIEACGSTDVKGHRCASCYGKVKP